MGNQYPTLTELANYWAVATDGDHILPAGTGINAKYMNMLGKDMSSLLENINAINLYMKFGLKDE